ncbi:hypothetical protein DFJ74DRAFT_476419 [Hyaloraphidium curvatum]|nr:hypothetical protein DFJ74DRAFT_476419 [Hyaloraphidium curvatum]
MTILATAASGSSHSVPSSCSCSTPCSGGSSPSCDCGSQSPMLRAASHTQPVLCWSGVVCTPTSSSRRTASFLPVKIIWRRSAWLMSRPGTSPSSAGCHSTRFSFSSLPNTPRDAADGAPGPRATGTHVAQLQREHGRKRRVALHRPARGLPSLIRCWQRHHAGHGNVSKELVVRLEAAPAGRQRPAKDRFRPGMPEAAAKQVRPAGKEKAPDEPLKQVNGAPCRLGGRWAQNRGRRRHPQPGAEAQDRIRASIGAYKEFSLHGNVAA